MSLFSSVIGSISPRLHDSFEDPHARDHDHDHDHELSSYRSSSRPRIPPPIASTILWNAPSAKLSPPPRVPDDLLVIQRKARHLEQQLQELLDAQADGLMSGLSGGNDRSSIPDDLVSNGSTTPTVSSLRGGTDRSSENEEYTIPPRPKKPSLNTARKRISRRIQQLSSVRAEELDLLDADLQTLQTIVQKTDTWTQKRSRLEKKITDISSETTGTRTQTLRNQASQLEREIRQKEEELYTLRTRHRRVLNDLADTENSVEAKLSTYKASLSYLEKEISSFLSRPTPASLHTPLSTSPFLTLPSNRRTLEMAQEFWHEEHTRLSERCEEVDMERAALDEGAVLWDEVVNKIVTFENELRDSMANLMKPTTSKGKSKSKSADPTQILQDMQSTISYLDDTLDIATQRGWNLLVCAIGAEMEAFKQGKVIMEDALGLPHAESPHSRRDSSSDGKGKAKAEKLVHTNADVEREEEQREQVSRSAIRIGSGASIKSPKRMLSPSPPKELQQRRFFDESEEDDGPDPELMISV